MGNGKRETKRGKLKVECFCYHEVNHAKSGKCKEEMKIGKLGTGGQREAVGAGLPTINDQKALEFLASVLIWIRWDPVGSHGGPVGRRALSRPVPYA